LGGANESIIKREIKMPSDENKVNPLFLQLILSLQSAAWYQLGKTVSPISGKIERNLAEAKVSIDLLTMLQEKTRDNLQEEEKKILDNTVYTLQMNYVEEVNEDKKKAPSETDKSDADNAENKNSGGKDKPDATAPENTSSEDSEK
jgi:hypothetical protein